jgi:hypothetical protein
MIVEPPQRSHKTPRLGANRELALGVVLMALLTAVLLMYFLGFYCKAREGWPCTSRFTATDANPGEGAPAEVPGGAPAPVAPLQRPLVPSQLFPPTPVPALQATPTAVTIPQTAASSPSPFAPATTVAPPNASLTARTPEAVATSTSPPGPGKPTNTLMPGVTPTATPAGGYNGPPTPTAPGAYP